MKKITLLLVVLIALADRCQAGKPTVSEQTEQEVAAERHEGTLAATRGNLKLMPKILALAGAPSDFEDIVGRTVVVSPHDLPGDFHFYRVTGGSIQISGGGTLLLNVECGSKFREGAMRELKFNFGRTNHGWSVVYYPLDSKKPGRLERDEEAVELWWPNHEAAGPEHVAP